MNNKLIIAVLLSATLFTFSCEDDAKEPSSEFLGEWTISKIEMTSCEEDGIFPFICTVLNCEKITFKNNGQYEYTQTINSTIGNSHAGTFIITSDGYLEICKNGIDCNNYEIVHEPGSNTFKTIDLNGTTGCRTEVTYTKVEQ